MLPRQRPSVHKQMNALPKFNRHAKPVGQYYCCSSSSSFSTRVPRNLSKSTRGTHGPNSRPGVTTKMLLITYKRKPLTNPRRPWNASLDRKLSDLTPNSPIYIQEEPCWAIEPSSECSNNSFSPIVFPERCPIRFGSKKSDCLAEH